MYKSVAHTFLLYGSKSGVVTEAMLKILRRFHHQMARRISGMTGKCVAGETWEYPQVVAVLESVGLYCIQEYILRQQATIAAQLACHPIYALCTGTYRRPGKSRTINWWDKYVVQ